MRSLDIAATGMLAQQLNVDVISNNIANMTTSGYKRQRPEFNDLLYQNIVRPGSNSSDVGTIVPAGIQLGTGVKAGSVYRINEQGTLSITDNQLDLALEGRGWFQVELPTGETGYKREGSFQLNENGEIVTSEGFRLEPGLTVPTDTQDITINANGEVFAKLQGQIDLVNVGQITLATFPNDAGLEAVGNNLLKETAASGAPTEGTPGQDGFASLIQGALENSNVNVVDEITTMITAQRAYEMNSKVIQTSDEMLSTTVQLR